MAGARQTIARTSKIADLLTSIKYNKTPLERQTGPHRSSRGENTLYKLYELFLAHLVQFAVNSSFRHSSPYVRATESVVKINQEQMTNYGDQKLVDCLGRPG
jgi:hypothetical protein